MRRLTVFCSLLLLGTSPVISVDEVTLASLPIIPSDVGKPPYYEVFSGPAPHSQGIGLHFDTRRFFYVYTDYAAPANHFAPSGWMGDYGDIQIDDANREYPADGQTCIKITYQPRSSQGHGWAGVYWQEPRNNWGGKPWGYDLSGMKRVTFWARGDRDDEIISVFKVGGIEGAHPDTDSAQIGPVTLTREWQLFTIDLKDTALRKISGGFAWAVNQSDNQGPITFYLDEIRYER
jgi:hypothetical protein